MSKTEYDECEYCEGRVENGLIYDGLSFDDLNCVIGWVLREHKKIWEKEKEKITEVTLQLTNEQVEVFKAAGVKFD